MALAFCPLSFPTARSELLTHFVATVKRHPKKPAAPRFLIRTHALTPETDAFLQQLAQEASDRIGWKVSGSAIIRALLRHAKGQGPAWAADALFPLIESEIQSGFVWGTKKAS